MPYSVAQICNMALLRAGTKDSITTLDDTSSVARKINQFFDHVLSLVLEEIKPKFAVKRVALEKSATSPADRYAYAYVFPSDYLCRVDDREKRPSLAPAWVSGASWTTNYLFWPYSGPYGYIGYNQEFPYEIERNSDDTFCVFTDYDNTSVPLILTYVVKATNPDWYTPSFVEALADRLAAEMSLSITDSARYQGLMQKYELSKKAAKATNQAQDSLENETGDRSWVTAGRY